ncbi:diguanylate cyclase domain-containing protein [Nocardia takedensis]
MVEPHHSVLVARWLQTLHSAAMPIPVPEAWDVLGDFVKALAAGLDADPFDSAVGVRIGHKLADLGFSDADLPIVSANVLYDLAQRSTQRDAGRRMTLLLVGIAQGFEAARGETALRGSDAAGHLFRSVFDNVAAAICVGDAEGVLIEANSCLANLVGVPAEELRGISIGQFVHPDDVDAIRASLFEKIVSARKGTVRIAPRMMAPDGMVRWVEFSITYVRVDHGVADYLVAVGNDVTEQRQLREELYWQARHDPLTGLPNRRHLLERIETLAAGAGSGDRIGLCFVDLDGFKEVNDRYGHMVGDQVLRTVATLMADSLSIDGRLVARIGGDEFMVLVPPSAVNRGLEMVAEAILAVFDTPITAGDYRVRMSASVGAVVANLSGALPEALLDAADRELYRAKKSGKGQWILCEL